MSQLTGEAKQEGAEEHVTAWQIHLLGANAETCEISFWVNITRGKPAD